MFNQLVHTDKIIRNDNNFVVDENIYKKDDYIFYDDESLLEETSINLTEGEYLWGKGN